MSQLGSTFENGNSILHRIDPRIRLLSSIFLIIPTALLSRLDQALATLVVSFGFMLLARLPLKLVAKRLIAVNFFIFFLWCFLPVSTPGQSIATIGMLNVTDAGLRLAILITLKSNAIVLFAISCIATIPPQDIGPAMQHLKVPEKICLIFLFTYRYIFVIHQEYQLMRQAMTARGFNPKTNIHTYRSYAWLVGMLLVKSWDRAERVDKAMRCRGFKGKFYSLTPFTTSTIDIIYCIISICIPLGIQSIRLMWREII